MNHLFLTVIRNHWRVLLIPFIAIIALLAFLFFPQEQANHTALQGETTPLSLIEQAADEAVDIREEPVVEVEPVSMIIDIQGAILHPGVYEITEENRLIDVIQLAGGYLPNANTKFINHAMKLTDELFIYIPMEGEELPEDELPTITRTVQTATGNGEQLDTININTATEADLLRIVGIGPAKASAIIEHREQQGPFAEPEAIMNVTGIGQKTFEKLQHQISVK